MQPIFIISLPRSGSTLLQRILMGHPQIASESEPWLMLPLVYMTKKYGTLSEYSHLDAVKGVNHFINNLPHKSDSFYEALRNFAKNLYSLNLKEGQIFYIDKTPRYYLIMEELIKIFPTAKFIVLVRNPLQIISSIISSFSNNNLRYLHFAYLDIFKGLNYIVNGLKHLEKNHLLVRYEDLTIKQEYTLNSIFNYLEVEWDMASMKNLDNSGLTGELGDQIGIHQYKKIEAEPLQKWKYSLNEAFRKYYLYKIMESFDPVLISEYGYNKEIILNELKNIKTKFTFQSVIDLKDVIMSKLIEKFYLNLYRKQVKEWTEGIVLR